MKRGADWVRIYITIVQTVIQVHLVFLAGKIHKKTINVQH